MPKRQLLPIQPKAVPSGARAQRQGIQAGGHHGSVIGETIMGRTTRSSVPRISSSSEGRKPVRQAIGLMYAQIEAGSDESANLAIRRLSKMVYNKGGRVGEHNAGGYIMLKLGICFHISTLNSPIDDDNAVAFAALKLFRGPGSEVDPIGNYAQSEFASALMSSGKTGVRARLAELMPGKKGVIKFLE